MQLALGEGGLDKRASTQVMGDSLDLRLLHEAEEFVFPISLDRVEEVALVLEVEVDGTNSYPRLLCDFGHRGRLIPSRGEENLRRFDERISLGCVLYFDRPFSHLLSGLHIPSCFLAHKLCY